MEAKKNFVKNKFALDVHILLSLFALNLRKRFKFVYYGFKDL